MTVFPIMLHGNIGKRLGAMHWLLNNGALFSKESEFREEHFHFHEDKLGFQIWQALLTGYFPEVSQSEPLLAYNPNTHTHTHWLQP